MPSAFRDEFEKFSDADIILLYEIIKDAERKSRLDPDASFGALLFASYDKALAKRGIENGNGSKYFMFILQYFTAGVPGDTPLQKFSNILAEVGIRVDFSDDEEEAVEEITRGDSVTATQLSITNTGTAQNTPGASRRASLGDDRSTSVHPDRYRGQARLPNGTRKFRSNSEQRHSAHLAHGTARGRLNHRSASDNTFIRRNRSISSNGSVRISRRPSVTSGNIELVSDKDTIYSGVTVSGQSLEDAPREAGVLGQYRTPRSSFRPSETELLEIADTFAHNKEVLAGRRLFRKWRDLARAAREWSRQSEAVADAHYQAGLTSDILNKWRGDRLRKQHSLDQQQHDAAKDRLLKFYEQQIDTARRERLLQKAFTHWHQDHLDRKQLTQVARRHIVRFRAFNGWQAVTVLNSLKVRRFGLAKFFGLWRTRVSRFRDRDMHAALVHLHTLKSRGYWSIYWATAGNWAADREKTRRLVEGLRRWVNIVREEQGLIQSFHVYSDHRLLGRLLDKWVSRTAHGCILEHQARDLYEKQLITRALGKWKINSILKRQLNVASQSTQHRLLQNSFSRWQRSALDARQATEFRDTHLLASTLQTLRFAHRYRVFTTDTNEWQKAEKFYKWRLAARTSAGLRQCQSRLLTGVIRHWADKAAEQRNVLEEVAEYYAATQRRVRLLSSLRRYVYALHKHEQNDERAYTFWRHRLLGSALESWKARHASIEHMGNQAEAARYYILTSISITRWKEQTQEHQKIRRRDAYAHIRRVVKMNICRDMLYRLRDSVGRIRAMERVAQDYEENQSMRFTVSTLTKWREKGRIVTAQTQQATLLHRQKLTGRSFEKLLSHYQELNRFNEAAVSFNISAVEREASNCFKKLDRRLFQASGQEQWALALRERHHERHVRGMLRYWAERALTSLHGKRADVVDKANWNDGEDDSPGDGAVEPQEHIETLQPRPTDMSNLIDLDDRDDFRSQTVGPSGQTGISTLTPLPGYLRTPSKRSTARAKARERLLALGTTAAAATPASAARARAKPTDPPATAPPGVFASTLASRATAITPFERKLQAQGYGPRFRPTTPARRAGAAGPAASSAVRESRRVGRFGGFEDIAEDEGL